MVYEDFILNDLDLENLKGFLNRTPSVFLSTSQKIYIKKRCSNQFFSTERGVKPLFIV